MGLFKRNNKTEVVTIKEETYNPTTAIFGEFSTTYSSTALSAFFAAIEMISNSIAMLPILVKQSNKVDYNHVLNTVFRTGLLSKFNLMKQLIWDLLIHGESLCYIERAEDGTPIELVYCEHGSFTQQYVQNKRKLYYLIPFCRKGRIEPIDVIHLYKNSNDGVTPKAITDYANKLLSLAKSTDTSAYKYYQSGCAIKGIISIMGSRRNAKEQVRASFERTHGGDTGSGLAILDDDIKYTPTSANANDTQMLESRQFNITEIARYFNINPVLLGDLSHTAYNSIEAANIEFVTHTLMPYVVMIEEEFNRKLFKPSEVGYKIDLDETYLLKGDKTTTANYLKTLTSSGIFSINEARDFLGMEAIEGGDKHIIPYTNLNDNTIEQTNTLDENKDGEQ